MALLVLLAFDTERVGNGKELRIAARGLGTGMSGGSDLGRLSKFGIIPIYVPFSR